MYTVFLCCRARATSREMFSIELQRQQRLQRILPSLLQTVLRVISGAAESCRYELHMIRVFAMSSGLSALSQSNCPSL